MTAPLSTPTGGPGSWRFLPFERWPRVVAAAQELPGKFLLAVVFALVLTLFTGQALAITAFAVVVAHAGKSKPQALTLATLGFMALYPNWFRWPETVAEREVLGLSLDHLRRLVLAVVLLLAWAALHAARRFPGSVLAKRPVVTLMLVCGAALAVCASGVLPGALQPGAWSLFAAFSGCLWFLCYALVDQRLDAATPPSARLGAFHAFFGSSNTPFGKGVAWLKKIEARNPEELAVTQLKAVKLLLWLCVLQLVTAALKAAAERLGVPIFEFALTEQMGGRPFPAHLCWASIVYTFFLNVLQLAIWGGLFVAGGRLAGYRLLRNTWRPLAARSIAEFWNRYYYFYKELLVDLFFFPTFLRAFKKHKRLRLAFATVMAAGVGNFAFHFLRDATFMAHLGFWKTMWGYQTFAFYCLVLSASIALSQLRAERRKFHPGWVRGQLLPSLGVMAFYCLLEVFMVAYSPWPLRDRFIFFARLFGIEA